MIKQPSCGFGQSVQEFYNGMSGVKNCLNLVYGPEDASYTPKSYPPDILRPPYGYTPTSFGKSVNVLKRDLKYLLMLNGTR
jgi:hypothetical protein